MKNLTLLLFLAATTLSATSQQLTVTEYLDKYGDSTGKENAVTYSIKTYTDTTKTAYTTKNYSIDGSHLNYEVSFRDSSNTWQYDGNYIAYHKNGQPKIKASYIRNRLNGEVSSWYASGQIKRKDRYLLDSLISGHCYTATGQDTTWFPYTIGISYGNDLYELYRFIGKNIRYPKAAYKNGIEGTVHIQFIIEKDGSVSHVKIRRSVSEQIDQEALRVFATVPSRWKPALEDGEPHRGYGILPVMFKLNSEW